MLAGPRSRGGFTLIELMVTITVFGLLEIAVAPDLSYWIRSLKVRGAAEAMQNGLQKARLEAVRSNRVVTLWLVSTLDASCSLRSDVPNWVLSLVDPSGNCHVCASTTTSPFVIEKFTFGSAANQVSLGAVDAGGGAATSISFDPLGQMSGNGLQCLRVSAASGESRTLKILVMPGGSIRMCDANLPSADARSCPAVTIC
mgnify:CR=1 FL=1